MRRYRVFLGLFAAAYTLAFGVVLPSNVDEAYTYHLATDPSLSHMLSALRNGADGTFPVFGMLAFAWPKLFGSSELALRLMGGLFVVLLVGQMGGRLRRYFPPMPAALALLLILANRGFIATAIQARGYGLLVFAFSLAFWSTWDLIESRVVSRRRWLVHGLYCGMLWLSHPLGMLYGSILAVLYAGFSHRRKTFSLTGVAAFTGGPLLFLVWLPSFLIQRKINVVFPPGLSLPGWQKYWDYAFLQDPIFFGVALIGGLLFLGAERGASETASSPPPPPSEPALRSRGDLVVYALAFIVIVNCAVALMDATGVIDIYLMLATRYVLVGVVPLGVLFAATFEKLEQFTRRLCGRRWTRAAMRAQQALVAVLLLLQMQRMWSEALSVKSTRESYLNTVAELAKEGRLDVLCASFTDAFFLQTRTDAPEVKYLMDENFAFRKVMLQHQQYYPQPAPISQAAAQRYPEDSVFVPVSGAAFIVKARPGIR
jgi:hypothetical protein